MTVWHRGLRAAGFHRASPVSDVDVQTVNQFAKFLARFEEGNLLRRHVHSGSGFWIACDSRSSLARMEASESADFNLVAGSQGADDAVEYGADDDVGFLVGQLNGLVNLFGQFGPGHLSRPRCITTKSITWLTVCPGRPLAASFSHPMALPSSPSTTLAAPSCTLRTAPRPICGP